MKICVSVTKRKKRGETRALKRSPHSIARAQADSKLKPLVPVPFSPRACLLLLPGALRPLPIPDPLCNDKRGHPKKSMIIIHLTFLQTNRAVRELLGERDRRRYIQIEITRETKTERIIARMNSSK